MWPVTSSPGQASLWTRGYGAPEVVKGRRGVNTLTDAYSLAVLAFETLSLAHPFRGDVVENGEPELEDEAFEGRLPWIDHPENGANRSSRGIPRDIVLSPLLRHICQRAFVEGLNNPAQRPGVMEWAERLHRAADLTLECPGCGGAFYYLMENCPWCDRPRPYFALIRVKLWTPQPDELEILSQKPVDVVSLALPGTAVLPRRIVHGRTDNYGHQPSVEVNFDRVENRFGVRSLDGKTYKMIAADQDRQEDVGGQTRYFPSTWELHAGAMSERHRFLTCTVYRGSQG
jgi:serine/threonine protein kinase